MKIYFSSKIRISRSSVASKTGGFTIVETLIAIAVLMIAIAGPLVVATKGLTSANYSKNQMIASYLAQESMEVVKSTRYNNMIDRGEENWLFGMINCELLGSNPVMCDASALRATPIVGSCDSILGCHIYYDPDSGYNTDDVGTPTKFYRYFTLRPTGYDETNGGSEKIVDVYVNWNEGTIPYQVHIASQITKIKR